MLAQFCTEYQDNVLGDETGKKKLIPSTKGIYRLKADKSFAVFDANLLCVFSSKGKSLVHWIFVQL